MILKPRFYCTLYTVHCTTCSITQLWCYCFMCTVVTLEKSILANIFSDAVHRYFLYDIISIDSIATKVNGVYSTHNVLTWALLNIRLVGIDS